MYRFLLAKNCSKFHMNLEMYFGFFDDVWSIETSSFKLIILWFFLLLNTKFCPKWLSSSFVLIAEPQHKQRFQIDEEQWRIYIDFHL